MEKLCKGRGLFEVRFNITLKLFSGERDETAHHVLSVSCLLYFASVMSRSVSCARRQTNILALRKKNPWVNNPTTVG